MHSGEESSMNAFHNDCLKSKTSTLSERGRDNDIIRTRNSGAIHTTRLFGHVGYGIRPHVDVYPTSADTHRDLRVHLRSNTVNLKWWSAFKPSCDLASTSMLKRKLRLKTGNCEEDRAWGQVPDNSFKRTINFWCAYAVLRVPLCIFVMPIPYDWRVAYFRELGREFRHITLET